MSTFNIINPYSQEKIDSFDFTSKQESLQIIENLASKDFHNLPSIYERSKVLEKLKNILTRDTEKLATQITKEMGKTLNDARGEIKRAILTIEAGIDLMRAQHSELLSTENYSSDHTNSKWGLVTRVPYGVILGIVPFNFPINLAVHKIIPSYAMGNSFILKPHPQCYRSTQIFTDLCYEAGMSKKDIGLICPSIPDFSELMNHPSIKIVSFTGGMKTAEIISKQLVYKKELYELGGNAALVVFDDADQELALEKIITHRLGCAGQRCTASKRVFIHEDIYEDFKVKLLDKISKLKIGDPLNEESFIGPVVNLDSAKDIEKSILNAKDLGANLLHGGSRDNAIIEPTVFEVNDETYKAFKEEIFGPIIPLMKFKDEKKLIEKINDTAYGLQCGIFTESLSRAKRLFKEIDVGTLIINDGSAFRADHFPFGGVKSSGIGREGIKYAMEEMSVIKTLVF